MERKRVTEEQINTICQNVVKKSFKHIKKIIADQIDIVLPHNKAEIHYADFVNIVILSMISIDVNMILSLNRKSVDKNLYIEIDKVISLYLDNLIDNLERQRQLIENEKMN